MKDIATRFNYPQGTHVYVNENLSPNMRSIHFNARKMKKAGIIEDTWFSNAAVRIKLKNGEQVVATHKADLYEVSPLYDEFSFDTEFCDRIFNGDIEKMDDLIRDFQGEVTALDC